MSIKITNFFAGTLVAICMLISSTSNAASQQSSLLPIEKLGKVIFFDHRLSSPPGQACASCHAPEAGWTPNRADIHAGGGMHPGAVIERFGNRKPPSAAYATLSPNLHYDSTEGLFIGGNFWDGRATGWLLGNPAADQAQGPFLNPVEHNNPDAQAVIKKVCEGEYGEQFREVFGNNICSNKIQAYNAIAQAISAFENSTEVNAFSSKYDYYLQDPQRYPLSELELQGLKLFEAENKGNCAACHPSQPGPNGEPPLFTDFSTIISAFLKTLTTLGIACKKNIIRMAGPGRILPWGDFYAPFPAMPSMQRRTMASIRYLPCVMLINALTRALPNPSVIMAFSKA